MHINSINVNNNQIQMIFVHNETHFGIVTNINVNGDGYIQSINDYYTHDITESDICIVSFKVNVGISRFFGLYKKHFKTECHKVVVDSKIVQTWVDGIKTRDMEHMLL